MALCEGRSHWGALSRQRMETHFYKGLARGRAGGGGYGACLHEAGGGAQGRTAVRMVRDRAAVWLAGGAGKGSPQVGVRGERDEGYRLLPWLVPEEKSRPGKLSLAEVTRPQRTRHSLRCLTPGTLEPGLCSPWSKAKLMVGEGGCFSGEIPPCGGSRRSGNGARQTCPGSVFSAGVMGVQERSHPLGPWWWGEPEETAKGKGSRGFSQLSCRVWRTSQSCWKPR